MDIVKIGNGIGLTALALVLVACGGSGGESSSPEPSATTAVSISTPIDIKKAIYDAENTITVEATADNGTDLKLASVTLRSGDEGKCELTGVDGLSYSFIAREVGECQFNYEVTPVSSAYSASALATTRVAVSTLVTSDSARVIRNADDGATRALTDTVLPIISKAYYADGQIPDTIDLTQELSAYDTTGYTIDSVSVLGKLANYYDQFTTTTTTITLPALIPEHAGFSRIEYSLTNGTDTKIAWIDISISNTDGTNRAPTLADGYGNYIHPDIIFVQKDSNDLPLAKTNEVIFNILWEADAPSATDLVSVDNTGGIPEISLYVMNDEDGDVLSVVNDNTSGSENLLGVIMYSGTTKVEDITNASGDVIGGKILVDIDRGGNHTMSYTISDDQGGFVVGLITFKLPLDIYFYGQEWDNITIDTNTAGIDADVARGVFKSTGGEYDEQGNLVAGASEITFSAPLSTNLAFFLDVDFKNVFVEEGATDVSDAKGPEGYVITTYSYEQAQNYCAKRNGRLPTLNELKFLTAKQGNNLYTDYAAPYTEPHNWPTSKPYWIGKKETNDTAYVFDLNGGTGESTVETGDATGASVDSGNYVSCVLFDEGEVEEFCYFQDNGLAICSGSYSKPKIKGFDVEEFTHSSGNSIDFNAWMQFRLVDPEGNDAGFERVDISANIGYLASASSSNPDYGIEPDPYTKEDGMMYFYYNRCSQSGSNPTCEADPTLTGQIYVHKGFELIHIYAYSNADSGENTAPLSLDIHSYYATNTLADSTLDSSARKNVIDVPDGTQLYDYSLIRSSLSGGALPAAVNGLTLWNASAGVTYRGHYLYRYPFTGKNFSMMIGLNECPGSKNCTPGNSDSALSMGLQQNLKPTIGHADDENVFTELVDFQNAPNVLMGSEVMSPAINDSNNLMFNIRRHSGNLNFFWTNTAALSGDRRQSLASYKSQFEYYWLDYTADTKELLLYVSNEPVKPNNPVREFTNVDWGGINPSEPYYLVIGYYSKDGDVRNVMRMSTLKYKSWD